MVGIRGRFPVGISAYFQVRTAVVSKVVSLFSNWAMKKGWKKGHWLFWLFFGGWRVYYLPLQESRISILWNCVVDTWGVLALGDLFRVDFVVLGATVTESKRVFFDAQLWFRTGSSTKFGGKLFFVQASWTQCDAMMIHNFDGLRIWTKLLDWNQMMMNQWWMWRDFPNWKSMLASNFHDSNSQELQWQAMMTAEQPLFLLVWYNPPPQTAVFKPFLSRGFVCSARAVVGVR